MRVDRRVSVRDLRILDVEPVVPVEPKAALVFDRLAPFLGGARHNLRAQGLTPRGMLVVIS
jgi:hypothetical protein